VNRRDEAVPAAGADDDAAWLRVLADGLAFLADEGFTLRSRSVSTSAASGRVVQVAYLGAHGQVVLSVTCLPDRDRVHTSVAHASEPFDFSDAGARTIDEPRHADAEGSGLEKLASYLQALRIELLTTHLGILHGEPFRHDAFDWTPYK
jgi:hypothetical protein